MLEECRGVRGAAGAAAAVGGAGVDDVTPCCRCAHSRRASPLACLAVCATVLAYNLLGGFLFLALEGSTAEETAVAASKPNLSQPGSSGDLRSKTVERLWSITEDLNILYKENWTKLAAKELMDFQKVLIKTMRGGAVMENRLTYVIDEDFRWTFSNSFLYALTLITTIGHGNVTPRSSNGKLAALVYACVGIPLVMLYFATLGAAAARRVRRLYARINPAAKPLRPVCHTRADCLTHIDRRIPSDSERLTPFEAALNLEIYNRTDYYFSCRDHTRVPIILSLLVIAAYVALGSLVFRTTEKWTFIDGCFFSFSSLATIGFGDFKPGLYASSISAKDEDIAVGVCCIYILVGIVVVAMCFNLIQEDMGSALKCMSTMCSGRKSVVQVHTADECEEKSVVS